MLQKIFQDQYLAMIEYCHHSFYCSRNAEDIVQDTFLIAAIKIEDLKKAKNQTAWLYRTMKNVARNKQREIKRFLSIDPEVLSTLMKWTEAPESVDTYALFLFAEEQKLLEPSELKLLVDYFTKGYTYRELAAQRGLSIPACKMRVFRAKQRLEHTLEKSHVLNPDKDPC